MFCGGFTFNINYLQVLILCLGAVIALKFKNSIELTFYKNFNFNWRQVVATSVFLFISILVIRLNNASEFLYFRF